MDIEEALDNFDRANINLAKLEAVWERARPHLPSGPSRGRDPEYDNLERVWKNLLPGLPRIEGWTVEDALPDIDQIGQTFIDYLDVDAYPDELYEAMEKPGRDLAEYRFRLERARRRLVGGRLEELVLSVTRNLMKIARGIHRESSEQISTAETAAVLDAIGEINRLMGDAYSREGPWAIFDGTCDLVRPSTGSTLRIMTGPKFESISRAFLIQLTIQCPSRSSNW